MDKYILPLAIQAIGTTGSVIGVVWRIQKAQSDKHKAELENLSKKHDIEMKALQESFKEELISIREIMSEWEKQRRNGDHALHERINQIESNAYKEINTRLSHIEGQLKGLNNVTRVMEEWLIRNGGKVE